MFLMFSVFDKKGVFFSNPFYVRSLSEALRAVQLGMEDGKTMFSRFPADFALYQVGHFDPLTGQITPTVQGPPQFAEELVNLVAPRAPSPQVDIFKEGGPQ